MFVKFTMSVRFQFLLLSSDVNKRNYLSLKNTFFAKLQACLIIDSRVPLLLLLLLLLRMLLLLLLFLLELVFLLEVSGNPSCSINAIALVTATQDAILNNNIINK